MKRRSLVALQAAAVGLALVPVGTSQAVVHERVANGGFESTDAQWTFTGAVICTTSQCGRTPSAGSRFASTSNFGEQTPAMITSYALGSVEQRVYVPDLPATVTFDMRREESQSGYDSYLNVLYDGAVLMQPEIPSGDWQPVTVPLPAEAVDENSAGTLKLTVFCDNFTAAAVECPVIDVDNVRLTTGTDTEPPKTSITSAPTSRTVKRLATFRFASDEAGSTFTCRFDDERWQPCTTPTQRRMKPGLHSFSVRAKDTAGNTDPSPAVHTWRVRRR